MPSMSAVVTFCLTEFTPTREAAQDAAVKAGAGHRDQATGRFYADVWTKIEEGE